MINFVLSISFQMNKEIRTLRLPALGSDFYCLVRLKGLEPPRRRHQILSLARLPISPQPHIKFFAVADTPPRDSLKHSRLARYSRPILLVSAPSQARFLTHRVRSPSKLPISPQPQNNAYIFYHIRVKLSTEKVFLFLYYY